MSELEQVTEIKNAIEIKTNKMKNIKDLVIEISMTDYLKICTKINDKAKALGPAPLLDRKKDKLINAPPLALSATLSEPAREYDFGGIVIVETEIDLIQYERPYICLNRDLFISYKVYRSDEGLGWDSSASQRAKVEGAGDIILPIRRLDRSRYEL
ncbi:hypothetical protein N7534_010949 [Penicillium rubens]|nr:hypothetical protein N7534_010949 [Penicillium rubens]